MPQSLTIGLSIPTMPEQKGHHAGFPPAQASFQKNRYNSTSCYEFSSHPLRCYAEIDLPWVFIGYTSRVSCSQMLHISAAGGVATTVHYKHRQGTFNFLAHPYSNAPRCTQGTTNGTCVVDTLGGCWGCNLHKHSPDGACVTSAMALRIDRNFQQQSKAPASTVHPRGYLSSRQYY